MGGWLTSVIARCPFSLLRSPSSHPIAERASLQDEYLHNASKRNARDEVKRARRAPEMHEVSSEGVSYFSFRYRAHTRKTSMPAPGFWACQGKQYVHGG